MPILEVEIVLPPDGTIKDDLAVRLANLAGQVFESPQGRTWVRLRTLPSAQYGENGIGNRAEQSDEIAPVFVTVLKSQTPEGSQLQKEVRKLTKVIAEACERPAENVHILYLPPASGRIAFGGNILGQSE